MRDCQPMVPTLYARFFADSSAIREKAKEVAVAQGYTITVDDPGKSLLHLHKREGGRMVHLTVYVGGEGERAVSVEVRPGDEGRYMDFGRQFIQGLRNAVR